MEDLIKNVKREYAKNQYHKNPNNQKRANNNYWRNKAIAYFKTENVTSADIAKVRNIYYKQYRDSKKGE